MGKGKVFRTVVIFLERFQPALYSVAVTVPQAPLPGSGDSVVLDGSIITGLSQHFSARIDYKNKVETKTLTKEVRLKCQYSLQPAKRVSCRMAR